jgi:hypothetical protein
MSAIANIAVYDGAATPVLHTLVPVSVTREKGRVEAIWREQLTGVPVDAQVSCTMSIEQMTSGVYKCITRVEIPVMESISGQNSAGYTAAPKVAYRDTMVNTGLFHERSTGAGRRSVRQLGINILGNVGTSVAAATTGPAPDLFDQLVAPV